MLVNGNCTIYNRLYNPDTKNYTYHKTNISGIWSHVDSKVSVTDTGIHAADICKIRIPRGNAAAVSYKEPAAYDGTGWTIQNGDYILLEADGPDITKPSDIDKTRRQFFKIISWSDNRYGTTPHWRIEGV